MDASSAPKQLKQQVNPKPLNQLTEKNPKKGLIYLCMECGEEYEEGKRAQGHACQENHRKWIRHTKLPYNWENPYKILAET